MYQVQVPTKVPGGYVMTKYRNYRHEATARRVCDEKGRGAVVLRIGARVEVVYGKE